jgi:hypothetical protein
MHSTQARALKKLNRLQQHASEVLKFISIRDMVFEPNPTTQQLETLQQFYNMTAEQRAHSVFLPTGIVFTKPQNHTVTNLRTGKVWLRDK